jgi:hypothetical protein
MRFQTGHDGAGPWPGCRDFQVAAPSAAHQPGSGVQDAVAQSFRLGFGEVAVEGQQPEPGQQDGGGQRGGHPRLVDLQGL